MAGKREYTRIHANMDCGVTPFRVHSRLQILIALLSRIARNENAMRRYWLQLPYHEELLSEEETLPQKGTKGAKLWGVRME